MKNWQIPFVAFALGLGSVAWGNEARQYCEDMYPVESYEADERRQYIDECIAVTDDDSYGDSEQEYSEPESAGDDYYDGTVEDFVNSVSEEPEQ